MATDPSQSLQRGSPPGGRTPTTPEASTVSIRSVSGRRDLNTFIKLPWRLYRGESNWVPPLISERRRHLNQRKNPFFDHAEAEYFLAVRDGTAVGRITAHVDHHLNSFQGTNWGLFGFYESENDPAVARALLETAENWLKERGCERMLGPFDFSTNHEVGVLVEGFEYRPQILENWHHPYYRDLFEGQGLAKAMDLYKWQVMIADSDDASSVFFQLADNLERDHGVRIRRMQKKNFEAELGRFREVYNAAWERNWGFVPLTDREIEHMAKELKPILDQDFALVAETDDEVVGVSLTLPDYNQVLARINGRLFPLGWLKALRAMRRIDEIRVFALGVKPAWRHTGVAAAFYADGWRTALERKLHRAETGWILETNEPMNRAMEALAGKIIKRYRVYERVLG